MKETVRRVNKMAGGTSALSFAHGRVNVRTDAGVAMMGWRARQREEIDFISTVANDEGSLSLEIPYTYGIVISAWIFYAFQPRESRLLPVPVLRLDLSYRDIGRHKHKSSFDIHFDAACCDPLSGEITYGYLEHRRRKRSLLFDWLHRLVQSRVVFPSYHTTRRVLVNPSSGADVTGGARAEDATEDAKETMP